MRGPPQTARLVGLHLHLRDKAGRHLLDRDNPVMRYLAQGAYWTYLLHLPLLFVLQYRLMDLDWPWPLKFAAASLGTLAACLLSYQLLVRHTPLRRFVG